MRWTYKAHISWIDTDTSDFSGKSVINRYFTEKKVKSIQSFPFLTYHLCN